MATSTSNPNKISFLIALWNSIKEKLKLLFSPALYSELESQIEDIDDALIDLQEASRKDNAEVHKILASITNKMEELTEKSLDIVNENGENIEDINNTFDGFRSLASSLSEINMDFEQQKPLLVSASAKTLFQDYTEEDYENGEYYASPKGVYLLLKGKMLKLYLDVDTKILTMNEIHQLPKLSTLTKIPKYGSVLQNISTTPESDGQQLLFAKSVVSRMQYATSERIAELEKYRKLVHQLLDDSIDIQTGDTVIRGTKDKLVLDDKDQKLILEYKEAEKKLVAYRNGTPVAVWKQNGKTLTEKTFFKKEEFNYEALMDNDYVYAFFETHGLARREMKERIQSAGEVGLGVVFPAPVNKDAFLENYRIMNAFAKCSCMQISDENGLFVKAKINRKTFYIGFKENGEPKCYFTKDKTGYHEAENSIEIRRLKAYMERTKTEKKISQTNTKEKEQEYEKN